MDKLKILITGGNGFLGASIVAALLNNNFDVIVLERNKSFTNRLDHLSNKIKIYFSEEINIEDIFKSNKINIVIHCATNYGINELISEVINTNVFLPVKIIECCKKFNVKYFISTDSFYNKIGNENYTYLRSYIKSKRHILDWLKLSSSDELQIFNMKLEHVYGPGDNKNKFVPMIIKRLLNNESEIDLTDGEQERDFIYIDDVVSAYIFLIKNINKFESNFVDLSIGTSTSITINDFVKTAKKITNSNSVLNFGKIPQRKNEIMFSVAEYSSLQENGWRSLVSLEDGLKKIIDFNKISK